MDVIAVSRRLWVMAQPSIEDFVTLKQRGFATVINNRPDGEAPDQPGSKAEELAAKQAGLAYVHPPVTSTGITKEEARRFQEAVDASLGPVVAHCRSGARAFFLGIMSGELENKSKDEVHSPKSFISTQRLSQLASPAEDMPFGENT
jgi:uncharacterized protein (TIGR01244 family)